MNDKAEVKSLASIKKILFGNESILNIANGVEASGLVSIVERDAIAKVDPLAVPDVPAYTFTQMPSRINANAVIETAKRRVTDSNVEQLDEAIRLLTLTLNRLFNLNKVSNYDPTIEHLENNDTLKEIQELITQYDGSKFTFVLNCDEPSDVGLVAIWEVKDATGNVVKTDSYHLADFQTIAKHLPEDLSEVITYNDFDDLVLLSYVFGEHLLVEHYCNGLAKLLVDEIAVESLLTDGEKLIRVTRQLVDNYTSLEEFINTVNYVTKSIDLSTNKSQFEQIYAPLSDALNQVVTTSNIYQLTKLLVDDNLLGLTIGISTQFNYCKVNDVDMMVFPSPDNDVSKAVLLETIIALLDAIDSHKALSCLMDVNGIIR